MNESGIYFYKLYWIDWTVAYENKMLSLSYVIKHTIFACNEYVYHKKEKEKNHIFYAAMYSFGLIDAVCLVQSVLQIQSNIVWEFIKI